MNLSGLTDSLKQHPAFAALQDRLKAQPHAAVNIIRAARPYLVAALAQERPIIYLTGRIKRAYNVTEQLPVWIPDSDDAPRIYRYSEPVSQFYERAAWGEDIIQSRLEALNVLMQDKPQQTPIIITAARALMQRTMPPHQFRQQTQTLRVRERISIDALLANWVSLGYESSPIVIQPGTFSRRGGVVDIFPIDARQPVRVDFFDDEIDSLRRFNPTTQRSHARIEAVRIPPAREALPSAAPRVAAHLQAWFEALPDTEEDMTAASADLSPLQSGIGFPYLEHYLPYLVDQPISVLDYAPEDALIIVEDWDELQNTVEDISEQADARRDEGIKRQILPPDYPTPYVDWPTIAVELERRHVLHLTNAAPSDDDATVIAFNGVFQPGGRYGGQVRPMLNDIRQQRNDGDAAVVITEQAERLKQTWYEQDASDVIPTMQSINTPLNASSLVFMVGAMQEGWRFNQPDGAHLNLITDAEIFGWSRPEPRRRKTTQRRKTPESDYADWKDGDYVVHVDYGVGQFGGMAHRTVDGNDREYLLVRFAGSDMIYVPIHQADRLTRYIGADDQPPTLSKLGKADWQRVRSKAQKAVEEEAKELLELYAARAKTQGTAFSPDSHWQHELEAAFPYVETEDQLRTAREVKQDMETVQPMDRLICGDVGFGKTEIALRAAFKAVSDGKQVAMLVPTTVLAQQHFNTFSNRIAPFPVKIEMMSRFRTKEHMTQLLPKIASGEIDIIIGTHRILSKDVTFKDLGLVIIDEEQRFGVKHKEHFKALRNQVDVLTLTATPIPRTLYMSLTGVRDISMIQTPPEERLPVITHVGRFDDNLVRQAVLRELERGGQVFIVHNRVRTIETLHQRIEELVPEARIVVGHGQMAERQLEGVMAAFARNQYDILISTTIIESGIDIPNANTLIVDHADHMGLAQLYQIRGRVGRSAQQGYAYFFHPRNLTEEAKARLETLAENTHLGAGMDVAMRDLEIRGAGDILSTKQTGHVSAIGLHLYTQLLTQTIKQLKGEADIKTPAPISETKGIVIDMPLAAYVPSDWIPDMAMRLQIYRRIAGINDLQAIADMRSELVDRFGQLPDAVDNLLYQIEVKLLAQASNATHIMANKGIMQIRLPYLGEEINRVVLKRRLDDTFTISRTAVSFKLDSEHLWKLRLTDVLTELSQVETLSKIDIG